ncbi:hypothetical protein ACQCN2_06265 [Brevibacillus ginsengisoli]|uniref:hypothetical protein n=1 Tax=Brevibacillus ginsengisoli TaxID=363854 RepID=UPI003CE808A0
MRYVRHLFVLFLACLILVPIAPAYAAEQTIIQHRDTVVSTHQVVENLVEFGGNATVAGTVRDSVIVMNGNLDIQDSAHIMGLVLVIGGNITQAPGAQVTDNILHIAVNDATLNSLLLGGVLVVGVWFVQLAFSILLLILPVMTSTIAKNRLDSLSMILRRSPGRLMAIGFLISLLIVALTLLLCITVIGIPVALLLVLGVALVVIVGLTVLSQIIGDYLPGSFERPSWINVLGGAALITGGINFPFLGGLLLVGIVWASLGMITIRLWETQKHSRS